MNNKYLLLSLILLTALWRVGNTLVPALFNIAPVTALAFCSAAYFRRSPLWLVPFAALALSDGWLDRYYKTEFGYTWTAGEMVLRALAVAIALGIGVCVSRRRWWATLFGGALACSVVFYFVTNTASWWSDPYYSKSMPGWWQALTMGHSEFPPTWWFFRNTLAGDLGFTAFFAAVMAIASRARVPVAGPALAA